MNLLEGLTCDNWLKGRLTDGHGKYCALGWMLHQKGVPDEVILEKDIGIAVELDYPPDVVDTIVRLNDDGGYCCGDGWTGWKGKWTGPGEKSSCQDRLDAIRDFLEELE